MEFALQLSSYNFKFMSIFIAALVFMIIPIGVFFVLSWFILYHLNKYGIEGDSTKRTASLFCFGIVLISIFIIFNFFLVNWSEIGVMDFIDKSDMDLYFGQ